MAPNLSINNCDKICGERKKRLFRIMLVARNIAKFWLQAKYESKLFKNILLFFFFPTNLLEP
jgi:hypothetical protein